MERVFRKSNTKERAVENQKESQREVRKVSQRENQKTESGKFKSDGKQNVRIEQRNLSEQNVPHRNTVNKDFQKKMNYVKREQNDDLSKDKLLKDNSVKVRKSFGNIDGKNIRKNNPRKNTALNKTLNTADTAVKSQNHSFTENQEKRNYQVKADGKMLNKETVKIIPLGGLEQIGMNITAIEYGNDIIIIDGGMSFPDDDMLGIDLVIPDITYLKENRDKVRGMLVTHGHEDHIGAIPYIEKELNIPIYATRLTMGLIEYKLTEHELINQVKRNVMSYGETVKLGCFKIEFIRTNHSIADSAALAISTPAGMIVHTGDFKVDFTPVFGDTIDLQRFGELGKAGVLALMMDSTNVERTGYTPSEKTVGKTFDHIFDDNRDNRIIIATFASNVDRVQQIINSAYKYGRKVIVDGRSMVNVIRIAQELGYIKVPDNTLINIDEGKNYQGNQLVYVTTGSQGENMAVLSRIAANIHQKIQISPDDVVVFSSNPIPGNEKSVSNIVNELEQKGARVIWHDAHVSGHACQEELKLIYALTKPKYSIPVHGEYRHLKRHSELAHEMGIPKENIKILTCGDVLEIGDTKFDIVGKVPAAGVLVDGLGVGDVGNIVLRDRQHLSQNGLIIVSLTLEKDTNQILVGPDIVSRGFVYVREAESLIDDCRSVAMDTLDKCMSRNITDWSKIKGMIKDSLGEFLWQRTKRSPMILPIISEV